MCYLLTGTAKNFLERFYYLTWPELEQSIIKGQITPQNWKNMVHNWSDTSGTHIPLNFCLRNASPLFSALSWNGFLARISWEIDQKNFSQETITPIHFLKSKCRYLPWTFKKKGFLSQHFSRPGTSDPYGSFFPATTFFCCRMYFCGFCYRCHFLNCNKNFMKIFVHIIW